MPMCFSANEREEENHTNCLLDLDQMIIDEEMLCETKLLDDDEEQLELVEIPQELPEKLAILKESKIIFLTNENKSIK